MDPHRFKKVVVLTGAGISADSGISTFRDSGGLWEQHRLEDVATPEAFKRDPLLVWRFYSARRKAAGGAQPNAAHAAIANFALARLQSAMDFHLVTQNVDMLHERAHAEVKAPAPIAMHGTLGFSRCTECGKRYLDDRIYFDESGAPCNERTGALLSLGGIGNYIKQDPKRDARGLPLSPCCEKPLRPHIVWFGEIPIDIPLIESAIEGCDLFVTIGTSGNVYPAAGFLHLARAAGATTVCINKEPLPQHEAIDYFVQGSAAQAVPAFFNPRRAF